MRQLFLMFLGIFLFYGCASLQPTQPLRYDGIYKEYSNSKVIYRKFEKDKHVYNTVVYDNENDQKAIEELDQLSRTNPTDNTLTGYTNAANEVRTYGTIKSSKGTMNFDGAIKKNERGELTNNFFLRTQNKTIQEILDLRVLDSYKLLTYDGQPLTNEVYESVLVPNQDYFIVKMNDKYGVLELKTNKMVVPCIYQWIDDHYSDSPLPRAFKINNKFGFFDEKFNTMIEAQYDELFNNNDTMRPHYFEDGIQAVKKENHWMIIDKNNRQLTHFPIDGVGEYFSKRFVPIFNQQKNYFEVYNLETQQFTGIKTYRNLSWYGYNIVDIGKGRKAIFDANGKSMLNDTYESIFSQTIDDKVFFQVALNDKKAILNKNGQMILPFKYQEFSFITTPDSPHMYIKAKIDYYHNELFDVDGKKLLPSQYSKLDMFNPKKGYFVTETSTSNSIVSPKIYHVFEQGNNEPLFQADYIWKVHPEDNYAMYRQNGLYGIIDLDMKVMVKPTYKNLTAIKDDMFAVYQSSDSTLYKIHNNTVKEVKEIDGRVTFEKNYIVSNYKEWKDLYDYQLNKLNKNKFYSNSMSQCDIQDKIATYKGADQKWYIVLNGVEKEIAGEFKSVSCKQGLLIVKLNK